MSTNTPSWQSRYRLPPSKIPVASPSGSPKERDKEGRRVSSTDKEAKRLSSVAREGEDSRPSTPSHPRPSSRAESHLPVRSHRPSLSLSSSSSFRPSTPSSHFNNSTSTPSSHLHHHHHTGSNPTVSTAPHTPKHDPNPHPYAIKTTSTALLSRSSSRSSSHYDSYHHYVPSSPSPSSPIMRKGFGRGGASASESEGEDGTNTGTGRHRYSRSLTGDEVPPLPVPPKEALGGVVCSELEAAKSDKEEEDHTPKKGAVGGRVRPSAKDLFASGSGSAGSEKGRGHRHSQSHGVVLERTGGWKGEGEFQRQQQARALLQGQHTGERVPRQNTGDQQQQLDILAELPADPKVWTVAQLSSYLVSELGSNPSSGVPARIANDIAAFVRNKRITGKAFLKLSEGELKEWGINQLWRSTLVSAKERLRRGEMGKKMRWTSRCRLRM
ncbi:hypothetical protein BJ165DRAFT_1074486 [Panaeolus papilionaceus]|nr:hypothetical protein BJ165DRAFT_1074486 [Panaeolus papilionaceus]